MLKGWYHDTVGLHRGNCRIAVVFALQHRLMLLLQCLLPQVEVLQSSRLEGKGQACCFGERRVNRL